MKGFIALAFFVGAAVAFPRPDHPAPPQRGPYKNLPPAPHPQEPIYKAAPPPPHRIYKEEEDLPPQPYEFKYGVSDQPSGTQFQAAETQSPDGVVLGSYVVNLPDGRIQTVTYRADKYGGFVADVKYEGEAVYPPEPAEGYGNNKYTALKPNYRPAPANYEA